MTLNMAHCRGLARGDISEIIEMSMNAKVAEPPWEIGRRYFEKVLIQCTRSTSPENALQGTGPRKEDVSVIDYVGRVQIGAGSIGTVRVACAELGNLDDRKRSAVPSSLSD